MKILAAISFDTLAFIALVIIASFFRWISKEAEKTKRKSEQSRGAPAKPTRRLPREETDQERVRRFLEALGQPTSSAPPKRIERRPPASSETRVPIPRGRTILSPLPPLTAVPPPLPVEVETPSPVPVVAEAAVSRAGVPMSPAREEVPASIAFPETSQRTTGYPGVIALLSSTRGLRDAADSSRNIRPTARLTGNRSLKTV